MGKRRAEEMASAVREGYASLDAALRYHLTCNHYPPVHTSFIETARTAIEACQRDEYDEEIIMPNGLVRTAAEIVEGLHLEDFLEQ
jgi:hypothetical protein